MTTQDIMRWLRENSDPDVISGMQRFGIPNDHALGVRMGDMKRYAKTLQRNHDVALQLWKEGYYEARTMAVFVAEPGRMTLEQADGWCNDFDNWAICDTACFDLFDRTPFAWNKVHELALRDEEFVRRAAFALVWALARHDKVASDAMFEATFPLMQGAADDDRPLVKKAIDMALRATGQRSYTLNRAAQKLAMQLADMDSKTAACIGRQAIKKLDDDALVNKLKARAGEQTG